MEIKYKTEERVGEGNGAEERRVGERGKKSISERDDERDEGRSWALTFI